MVVKCMLIDARLLEEEFEVDDFLRRTAAKARALYPAAHGKCPPQYLMKEENK